VGKYGRTQSSYGSVSHVTWQKSYFITMWRVVAQGMCLQYSNRPLNHLLRISIGRTCVLSDQMTVSWLSYLQAESSHSQVASCVVKRPGIGQNTSRALDRRLVKSPDCSLQLWELWFANTLMNILWSYQMCMFQYVPMTHTVLNDWTESCWFEPSLWIHVPPDNRGMLSFNYTCVWF
jgi:hypothetical protein